MKRILIFFSLGLFTVTQLSAQTNTFPTSGNVGVGTTSPSSKLQVEGRASVGTSGVLNLDWTYETNWGGYSGKWAGYIGFNAYRNNEDTKDNYFGKNKYTSKGVFEGSNYGFRWLFRKDNGYDSDGQHLLSEYMRLDNNGNLGIGTTLPSEKLEVYGNGASIKLNASNASSLYSLKFTSNYSYSNKFTIKSGDAVIMQEKSIIDVGGTGNTFSKLFLSNYYGIGLSTESNPASEGDINLFIAGHNNSVQKGNIGIGTTTPDAKLAVKGNIHTNEVKVDLLGAVAPDYVFYKDYDLKTLTEVENYIAKEGHLSNIPSAIEMETNGIYLKEMNLKLLEKIEELTLYTIQQEKEIKASKDETTALKKEIGNQKVITEILEGRLQKIEALLNSVKQ